MNNEELYQIPEISDPALLDIDTDAEWERLSAQLGFKKKGRILKFDLLIKIAAAILIVAATSVFVYNNTGKNNTQTFAAINAPVETTVETSTHISINRNSSVVCSNADKDKFSVELKGEAYFDVEKNPERTFEINTHDIKVIVHGTSFNICEQEGTTTVTVTSGVVEVISNKDGKSVTITKDEQLTCDNQGQFQVENVDNYNNIAWKLKDFKFNDVELGEIMQQLARAYGFSYTFENPEAAQNRISGSFSNQEAESVITILSQALDNIAIEKTSEGNYVIRQR